MVVGEVGAGDREALAGKVTEFVRVGDTVRRPATANTESMRQLLMHLERVGFGGAPQVVDSQPDGGLVLTWIEGWVPADAEAWDLAHALWQFGPVCADDDPLVRDWPEPPNRSERIAALLRGYRLDAFQAQHLSDMVAEVIDGIRRSVVRKAAAGSPAFTRLKDEGVLDDLDQQRRAAEQHRSLIVDAAITSTS